MLPWVGSFDNASFLWVRQNCRGCHGWIWSSSTYRSKFSTANGFLGRAFLTLLKLSLKLMGMREVPGIFADNMGAQDELPSQVAMERRCSKVENQEAYLGSSYGTFVG